MWQINLVTMCDWDVLKISRLSKQCWSRWSSNIVWSLSHHLSFTMPLGMAVLNSK